MTWSVFLGIALRVIDWHLDGTKDKFAAWTPTRFPPFHHCFTLGLLSGGVSLGAITFFEWLSSGRFISSPWRRLAIGATAPLVLMAFVAHATTSFSFDQIYPTAFWYLAFRFAPFFGFPAFLWTAAASWGVRIGGAQGGPDNQYLRPDLNDDGPVL